MNTVILSGNIAKIEESQTKGGTAVANIVLANNEKYKGEEQTVFIKVEVYGKIAENCLTYLEKSSKIEIQGKLRQSCWEDQKTGQNRYSDPYIVADKVEFLGKKKDNKADATPAKPAYKKEAPAAPAKPNAKPGQYRR